MNNNNNSKTLLGKAWEIENKSIISYMGWLKILNDLGIYDKKIMDLIVDIIEDSLIHKRIVEAVVESLSDIKSLRKSMSFSAREDKELYSSYINKNECNSKLLILIRNMIIEHDKIEKEAVEVYRELANKFDGTLIGRIFALILADEEKHDEYISRIDRLMNRICVNRDNSSNNRDV